MSFRADFYLGRGSQAIWLGSLREGGAPVHLHRVLRRCIDMRAFYADVYELVTSIPDGVPREQGWPWDYESSLETDYSYAFDQGHLYVSCYGSPWVPYSALDCSSLVEDYDFDLAPGKVPTYPETHVAGYA